MYDILENNCLNLVLSVLLCVAVREGFLELQGQGLLVVVHGLLTVVAFLVVKHGFLVHGPQ